ncbi:pseudouridine synthase, partial [Acinetobacter baumannii]|nr:pseudouridine synthase [Acinetobacter baumannii]
TVRKNKDGSAKIAGTKCIWQKYESENPLQKTTVTTRPNSNAPHWRSRNSR